MHNNLFVVSLVLLLGACGGTSYTASSQSMGVQEARRVVSDSLTQGAYVFLGNWEPSSKIYEVRFRRDAFGFAVQQGAIDWSLFNDVKYAPPSMKVCPLAEASTSVQDYGPLNSNYQVCKQYQVETCGMTIGFCRENDARRFADAIYVLKVYAR